MRDWHSQSHVKHYCRYHVVLVPKYRKKAIYGTLRKEIGGIFRELCRQGGLELVERYAMRDHIHMLLMIPLKFSVSHTVGYLKENRTEPYAWWCGRRVAVRLPSVPIIRQPLPSIWRKVRR
jgi:REP element-mobilizing transposase RayT